MPKSKKDGGQRYDWEALKIEYVTSDMSLRQLAVKHGINTKTVFDKSKADNWFATKKKYQKDTTAKAIAKASAKKANKMANEIASVDSISDALMGALKDGSFYNKHVVTESVPAPEGIGVVSVTYAKDLEYLNAKATKDVLQSLKIVEELKRSLNGILNERQQIDRDRLQLERERFEFEKQKATQRTDVEKSNYGVVILPEVLHE